MKKIKVDETASPTAAERGDPMEQTRRVEFPDEGTIPRVPEGFTGPEGAERSRLRKIGDNLVAEAHKAVAEVAADAAGFRKAFGAKAPDPATAARLAKRLAAVRATVGRLKTLLTFLETVEDVVLHDVAVYLDRVREDYDYAAKKDPNLPQSYPGLRDYYAGVSRAISEGIARSKSAAKTPKTP